jgi:hypothetical protein
MPQFHLSTSKSEQPHDFVLFENDSIYASYQVPSFSHQFQPVLSAMAYPSNLGESDELHQQHHQHQDNMNYPLTSSIGVSLPMASSTPGYESHSTYSFNHSDAPRTYRDQPLTSAPDVLIHPPTLSYNHSSQLSHNGEYRATPSASPATSVGGSGISGSEAGSARNSPYSRSIGTEEHRFATIDPTFSGAKVPFSHAQLGLTLPPGIDPSLVSNSPTEQPLSAVSPYGSPNWTAIQSPSHVTSNPSSPDLGRHPSQNGRRLSPSGPHHTYNRHTPYPPRRPSTGSEHSGRSIGSPTMHSLDHEDIYVTPTEAMGYTPTRSPQRSPGSARLARAGSSSDSIHSVGGHCTGKDGKETLCTECNKCFRDLRAHQLTHQLERPEKCPIATCEYSKKGFARKYDCQRHTLTHYKGTMVCGFCPGSGSAMEKSFNRADVFKRHLMAVHNVEQTPPNGRQKKISKGKGVHTGDFTNDYLSGKCSTCDITFATAQQFYEHLDDCVLSKVVEKEPAAAANERNLAQIKLEDIDDDYSGSRMEDDEDDEDEELGDVDEMEDDEEKDETYTGTPSRKAKTGSRAPSTRSKSKTLKRSGSGNSR